MKLLIVDDEPRARDRLRRIVEELDAGEVVGEASHGVEALQRAHALRPDVVLLDIRMPGMDGLEVARHLSVLSEPPAVIFTTAYDEHALAAFETQAVAYLLKPIRRDRMRSALAQAGRLTRAQIATLADPESSAAGGVRTHIGATLHGNLLLVPVEDVRFLRAEHKYVTVRHTRGEVIVEESLGALEVEFAERFLRVHRNALVSTRHVRALEKGGDGRQRVTLDGVDEQIEISRRLLPGVRRALRRGPAES